MPNAPGSKLQMSSRTPAANVYALPGSFRRGWPKRAWDQRSGGIFVTAHLPDLRSDHNSETDFAPGTRQERPMSAISVSNAMGTFKISPDPPSRRRGPRAVGPEKP